MVMQSADMTFTRRSIVRGFHFLSFPVSIWVLLVESRSKWSAQICNQRRAVFIDSVHPDTWAEKFENFERINSIRETNGNFDSCNSCKRLVSSRLHELHESKFPFVSRIEFIRSKLSNCSAHVSGVSVHPERPLTSCQASGPAWLLR